MTIYYVNPITGSNSNSGLSWALAWRSIKGNGTALLPGDEVRYAKSTLNTTTTTLTRDTNGQGAYGAYSEVFVANTDITPSSPLGFTVSATGLTIPANTAVAAGATMAVLALTAGFTLSNTKYGITLLGVISSLGAAGMLADGLKFNLCTDSAGATVAYSLLMDINGPTVSFYNALPTYASATLLNASLIKSIAVVANKALPAQTTAATITWGGAVHMTVMYAPANNSADYIPPGAHFLTPSPNGLPSSPAAAFRNSVLVQEYGQAASTFSEVAATPYVSTGGYSGSSAAMALSFYSPFPWSTLEDANWNLINGSGAAGNPITISGGWDTATNTKTGVTAMVWTKRAPIFGGGANQETIAAIRSLFTTNALTHFYAISDFITDADALVLVRASGAVSGCSLTFSKINMPTGAFLWQMGVNVTSVAIAGNAFNASLCVIGLPYGYLSSNSNAPKMGVTGTLSFIDCRIMTLTNIQAAVDDAVIEFKSSTLTDRSTWLASFGALRVGPSALPSSIAPASNSKRLFVKYTGVLIFGSADNTFTHPDSQHATIDYGKIIVNGLYIAFSVNGGSYTCTFVGKMDISGDISRLNTTVKTFLLQQTANHYTGVNSLINMSNVNVPLTDSPVTLRITQTKTVNLSNFTVQDGSGYPAPSFIGIGKLTVDTVPITDLTVDFTNYLSFYGALAADGEYGGFFSNCAGPVTINFSSQIPFLGAVVLTNCTNAGTADNVIAIGGTWSGNSATAGTGRTRMMMNASAQRYEDQLFIDSHTPTQHKITSTGDETAVSPAGTLTASGLRPVTFYGRMVLGRMFLRTGRSITISVTFSHTKAVTHNAHFYMLCKGALEVPALDNLGRGWPVRAPGTYTKTFTKTAEVDGVYTIAIGITGIDTTAATLLDFSIT